MQSSKFKKSFKCPSFIGTKRDSQSSQSVPIKNNAVSNQITNCIPKQQGKGLTDEEYEEIFAAVLKNEAISISRGDNELSPEVQGPSVHCAGNHEIPAATDPNTEQDEISPKKQTESMVCVSPKNKTDCIADEEYEKIFSAVLRSADESGEAVCVPSDDDELSNKLQGDDDNDESNSDPEDMTNLKMEQKQEESMLYTPPKKTQGLTDEEYEEIFSAVLRYADEVSEISEVKGILSGKTNKLDNNRNDEMNEDDLQESDISDVKQKENEVTPAGCDSIKVIIERKQKDAAPKKHKKVTSRKKMSPCQLKFPLKASTDGEKLKHVDSLPNLSVKEKMLQRTIEELGTWVQCCLSPCKKWRFLSNVWDPTVIPDHWECSLNQDEDGNSCDKAEVEFDESLHIFTKYSEGSIVWAKMAGYPWWPAMVEMDPDLETYFELPDEGSMHPSHYHVVYLDTKTTRAWIKTDLLKPFSPQDLEISQKPKKYGKELEIAEENALEALKYPIKERLKLFGFGTRYKGKWRIENFWNKDKDSKDNRDSASSRKRKKKCSITECAKKDNKIKDKDDEDVAVSRKKKKYFKIELKEKQRKLKGVLKPRKERKGCTILAHKSESNMNIPQKKLVVSLEKIKVTEKAVNYKNLMPEKENKPNDRSNSENIPHACDEVQLDKDGPQTNFESQKSVNENLSENNESQKSVNGNLSENNDVNSADSNDLEEFVKDVTVGKDCTISETNPDQEQERSQIYEKKSDKPKKKNTLAVHKGEKPNGKMNKTIFKAPKQILNSDEFNVPNKTGDNCLSLSIRDEKLSIKPFGSEKEVECSEVMSDNDFDLDLSPAFDKCKELNTLPDTSFSFDENSDPLDLEE